VLIEDVTDMIAKARGHDPAKCNDKCQCYRLALDIMIRVRLGIETRENELLEKLNERTDKLLQLQRLVGEEA
jgi:hypothetical protein